MKIWIASLSFLNLFIARDYTRQVNRLNKEIQLYKFIYTRLGRVYLQLRDKMQLVNEEISTHLQILAIEIRACFVNRFTDLNLVIYEDKDYH